MTARAWLAALAALAGSAGSAHAQQMFDPSYVPVVDDPAHPAGAGPTVAVDSTHANFHIIGGRYEGFRRLLVADGYVVSDFSTPFTPGCASDLAGCAYAAALMEVDVLVISNAQLPFGTEEAEVITRWLTGELDGCTGGSECRSRRLFLVADHQSGGFDFPVQIAELSARLGLDWPNGNVETRTYTIDPPFDVASGGMLEPDHPIVDGVLSVETFYGSGFALGDGLVATSLLTLPPGATWTDATGTSLPGDGYSQGAAFELGNGRGYVSGEAAMFTAQLNAAGAPLGMHTTPYNERYLRNIMHWLDGEPAMPPTDGGVVGPGDAGIGSDGGGSPMTGRDRGGCACNVTTRRTPSWLALLVVVGLWLVGFCGAGRPTPGLTRR